MRLNTNHGKPGQELSPRRIFKLDGTHCAPLSMPDLVWSQVGAINFVVLQPDDEPGNALNIACCWRAIMYWRKDKNPEDGYRVPDDVYDLVFRLHGKSLGIDHAWALAQGLRKHLDDDTCARIGVHGIRMAGSGNGWTRSEHLDAELPLSRRARLVIRVHRDDCEQVTRISNRTLRVGVRAVEIGTSTVRKLSDLGTLYARAICCDAKQSEQKFLEDVASRLYRMEINVSRMICGKSSVIRGADKPIFTRALMVADLKPEESVLLQQRGIGDARLLGCGLFVPHKGINAVYQVQE